MHLREIKTVQKGAHHTRSVSDSSKKEEYLVTNNQDNLAQVRHTGSHVNRFTLI